MFVRSFLLLDVGVDSANILREQVQVIVATSKYVNLSFVLSVG